MIEKIDDYLIGLAIGVRYRANFSIEDSLGSIVDKVLYDKKSYFNPKVFPMVKSNPSERILYNYQNNDKLTINNSNIILDLLFDGSFTKDNYNEILEKFKEQITDGIMKQYKITEISRIGIIRRYLFKLDKLANSFISKTIGNTIEGINDINLSFSKRFPVADSLVNRDILDYTNVIFNIMKLADKDELFVSVDYQKHFDPFLNSTLELKYDDFVKSANHFNSNNYLSWLNVNYLG